MAVKVMLAPAIVRREEEAAAKRAAPVEPKPKRRRSAVYDADGNEVFLTLMCLKCHKMRPLSQFGLRKMADGAIRNQPWCRTCRSGASPKARKESAETGEPFAAAAPAAEPQAEASPRTADAGILAAQVATALYRGRG
jgi:hypothetical protein